MSKAVHHSSYIDTSITNEIIEFKSSMNNYSDDEYIRSIFDDNYSDDLDNSELFTNVNNYISTLPQYEQNLIYLYAIHGSYDAVAKRLNLSIGIVYKYIHNIILKIHEHISKHSTDNNNNMLSY